MDETQIPLATSACLRPWVWLTPRATCATREAHPEFLLVKGWCFLRGNTGGLEVHPSYPRGPTSTRVIMQLLNGMILQVVKGSMAQPSKRWRTVKDGQETNQDEKGSGGAPSILCRFRWFFRKRNWDSWVGDQQKSIQWWYMCRSCLGFSDSFLPFQMVCFFSYVFFLNLGV